MKKIISFIVAGICLVMFAPSVYSADNLSISGSYHVRGQTVDTGTANDEQRFRQRMRLFTTIKAADGVSAVIRADVADATWGSDFGNGPIARPGAGGSHQSKIDIDRSYVSINKDNWSLTAGQQYMGFGIYEVVDANPTGFNFGLNFDPVKLNLMYGKITEGAITADDDIDLYAATIGVPVGGMNATLFYATLRDDNATKTEPFAAGAHIGGALGKVNLSSELAIFGGDSATVNYSGTQLYLKADSAVSDMVTMGAELYYAKGDDTDTQIIGLTDWWSFVPFSNDTSVPNLGGFFTAAYSGSSLFDPFGTGAGSIGADVFFRINPMEKLSLGGKVGYFTAEEDARTDGTLTAFNAYASYLVASNTTLSLFYLYSDPDIDTVGGVAKTDEEATKTALVQLAVSF